MIDYIVFAFSVLALLICIGAITTTFRQEFGTVTKGIVFFVVIPFFVLFILGI